MYRKTLQRVVLRREFITIQAFKRPVAVKLGFYGEKLVNVYPEYEHCKVHKCIRYETGNRIDESARLTVCLFSSDE